MHQKDSKDLENIKRKIAALKKLHDGAFQIHSYHEAEAAAFMCKVSIDTLQFFFS